MIVNAFVLCGSATATEAGLFHITDAGIRQVQVPVAADWEPGQPFGFEVSAVLMAANQSGDTSDHPFVEVHLRHPTNPEYGSAGKILLSGWRDGPAGSKFIHDSFPLTFRVGAEGVYMLTLHPEGMGTDQAAAMYLLDVVALKQ